MSTLLAGLAILATIQFCSGVNEIKQERLGMSDIKALVDSGAFSTARTQIRMALDESGKYSDQEIASLAFELDRMDRIERDFRATPDAVYDFIKTVYPDMGQADIDAWEASKALEYKTIDGEKRYFAWAGRNLFRIDPRMKAIWDERHPDEGMTSGSGAKLDLDHHNAAIIQAAPTSESGFVLPKRIKITQSIELKPGIVPAGEVVRCWIPYPRKIDQRQDDITLHASQPSEHILAPPEALQRTIYMEAKAPANEPLRFSVSYSMTARGFHRKIDPEQVSELKDEAAMADFLKEEAPHIVFTPKLQALSKEIIGDETNPYRKAQRLYAWIDSNIPWASAREYSTIRCIPEYAFENGHGDCGIQTLLFITLCRMNGIPARWQSGWELQPPDDSMHDWGLIYFEGYGWVPMDVTYGLRQSEDPVLKWFYLSGMDSYRIIFNDAISEPFHPPKDHVRSETVDSQRGELEWAGGNLYFSDWSWDFQWELLEDVQPPKK
jgi:hypothetical protein